MLDYDEIYKELGPNGWNYLTLHVPIDQQQLQQQQRQPCPLPQLPLVEMEILPESEMPPRRRHHTLLLPFGEPGHIARRPQQGKSHTSAVTQLSLLIDLKPVG